MGKKMKLVLDDLKVKSFVTELEGNQTRNAKGGITGFCTNDCTEGPECDESDGIPCETLSCGGTCDTCVTCATCASCVTYCKIIWTQCHPEC